jgi:hypothetical protein
VGWLMAEVRLLEQWVVEGTSLLWHDDSGKERLLTHYDDDVGYPVTPTTATRAAPAPAPASGTTHQLDRGRRGLSSASRGALSATNKGAAATHATAVVMLRRHAYIVNRASGAVRALCGEIEGRVREADRLRAADPSITPAQRLLLRSPRLQQEYAVRLSVANERLRLVLAAEEAHHPAWWQWLATAVIDADADADGEGDGGDHIGGGSPDVILARAGGAAGRIADVRREFIATLEQQRDMLVIARRKWAQARQRLRGDVVRAERALAKAEKAVHDAAATQCPKCRRSTSSDTRDGGAPAVLCSCVFDTTINIHASSSDAAAGDGAHVGVGLRRTFCVDADARAPRGAVSAAAEAERARRDLDNLRAEVAAAAKANTDLLQILLTKAPSLVLVK